ncbi:nucleoside triphosphate pyrophosphohydrolase [Hyphomicrobium sp.]|uniref:nucleoside triphosphate pyrophosphohydrolase n=1 Tax=Hyphomicrobium sp. TaxID=82 RepID=UPI001D35426D|nr:nucleoside triphosphate pyrophosphohydrolase [Hyphomicrobium sp.]MBY0559240.1 nucleoside triphosphate pyrophosphohydrolase [Hyphomicrobium sp.]
MAATLKPSRDITRLIEIMAALRTPKTGCPWDLEQTFETIAPYTIEEAYEVADAIARNDLVDLKDELGDLLLQVVYHSRIAEEQGSFAFGDVVESSTKKMIRRHPHVFGDGAARDPSQVKSTWEEIKAAERAEKAAERSRMAGAGSEVAHKSATLADVPVGLPALTRAIKLQDKAARVGFDWANLQPVFEKLKEEVAELEEVALPADPRRVSSVALGDSPLSSRPPDAEDAVKEEFGDMLFVMANIARHLKLDPEAALRGANDKFVRRFAHIEKALAERGKSPSQSSLDEMDALWDEAKALEKR